MQLRLVRCQDHLGQAMPDLKCEFSTRPHNSRKCNSQPCKTLRYPKYLWKRTRWSEVCRQKFNKLIIISVYTLCFLVFKVLRPRRLHPRGTVRGHQQRRQDRQRRLLPLLLQQPQQAPKQPEEEEEREAREEQEEEAQEAKDVQALQQAALSVQMGSWTVVRGKQ